MSLLLPEPPASALFTAAPVPPAEASPAPAPAGTPQRIGSDAEALAAYDREIWGVA